MRSNDEEDKQSWISIDDEEMSNAEEWDTVDQMESHSDITPQAKANDHGALTATPDSMSECSMRTAVGVRGGSLLTQCNNTALHLPRLSGIVGPESPATAHTGASTELEREPLHGCGKTAVYDNINANITLTESEPRSLFTAASCTTVATRGLLAPNQSVYGHLSPEELDEVFEGVNEHPNDMIVDGLRRLNDKYIVLRKVGEVCIALVLSQRLHQIISILSPNYVRITSA
jgi:hypothetical protein